MKLIGINGFKTSGKDTVYGLIKALRESPADQRPDGNLYSPHLRVERRAFADSLKIMAAKALGFDAPDEQLVATMDDFKETGELTHSHYFANGDAPKLGHLCANTISGRAYLQNFGAKAREVFGDTFWVDQVVPRGSIDFATVWETLGRAGECVGTLPAIGCITDVRYPNEAERILNLDGIVLEIIRTGLESDGHGSEQPLPRGFSTYVIYNDGSLDDLRDKVSTFLRSL